MKNSKIYVTKPYLPPKEEFDKYLSEIWDSRELTNCGKFHEKLENSLSKFLGVKYVSLFSSGTSALIVALRALEISGEVITTPYSFVATSHALKWNDISPVFVDIEPDGFNIDPKKVEGAITENTTAILAVHCYGFPAKLAELEGIAKKHNLKLIYDAAHAFGVKLNGESILRSGDLSILSFHATKVFNTFEGGAIICPSSEMKKKIDNLKNFGFTNEISVETVGINGKMAEINAALGLAQLPHFEKVIGERSRVDRQYKARLEGIGGIKLYTHPSNVEHNYSYFPITVENDYYLTRDELFELFRNQNIMVRRYFYPLITEFNAYKSALAPTLEINNALETANKILCLPIYPDLTIDEIDRICDVISQGSK